MDEVTGYLVTVDGKQVECAETDWGRGGVEIQDAKLVLTTPVCADSDIENELEVKGNVAVITRGIVPFAEKVKRAVAVGAAAVIITNNSEENPDEIHDFGPGPHDHGTSAAEVPVLGVSYRLPPAPYRLPPPQV